jgi:hypothetical protein
VLPPGEHEQNASVCAHDQAAGQRDLVACHDEMSALGRPDPHCPVAPREAFGLLGPGSCSDHAHPGADFEILARLCVPEHRAHDPVLLTQEANRRRPVERYGAEGHRRADNLRDIARIVNLSVVVQDGPGQGVWPETGAKGKGLPLGKMAVERQASATSYSEAEQVVKGDPGAHVRPLDDRFAQRPHDRDRVGQMGCEALHYESTFLEALSDQAEVQHLEVPQTTVDELARPAGGASCPVLCFDQAHREPTRRSVQGDSGTRYPTSDDKDVQLCGAQASDVVTPAPR